MKVYNKYENKVPADAVYIGRGSPWGNPFVIGQDGSRDDVCNKYEKMVENNPKLKARVREKLRGKRLETSNTASVEASILRQVAADAWKINAS